MSEYKEFRRRATVCLTLSHALTEPAHKAAMVEMSYRWMEMAEDVKDLQPRTAFVAPRPLATVIRLRD